MAMPSYRLNKLVILMPIFNTAPISVDVPTGIGVKFKGKKVPVVLQFGNGKNKYGGLMGIGLEDVKRRIMYRMDHHPAAPGHGGKYQAGPGEIAYWVSGNYHHHSIKWNQ